MQGLDWASQSAAADSWAQAWLEAETRARLVLDEQRRLWWLSPMAAECLAQTSLFRIRAGALCATDGATERRMEAVVERALTGDRPSMTVVGNQREALIVEACPLKVNGSTGLGLTLRRVDQHAVAHFPDLNIVFGLTASEWQVLGMMLRGSSVQEIAEHMHHTVLTVRTHFKHIYSKCDVSSKEQLFARLAPYLVA